MVTLILDNFLSSEECKTLIDMYESGHVKDEKGRFDSCYPIDISTMKGGVPNFLSERINKAGNLINQSVIDWIQVVKWYSPNKGKKLHKDFASDKTTLSSIIYLNDDYKGGQTYFEDGTIFTPIKGRALFFDGVYYNHGVKKIQKGKRYVVATWMKNKNSQ